MDKATTKRRFLSKLAIVWAVCYLLAFVIGMSVRGHPGDPTLRSVGRFFLDLGGLSFLVWIIGGVVWFFKRV